MSEISIEIFGNPVAFAPSSLHFTAPIGNQRGTCDFVMDDIEGAYVPKIGQLVEVFEDSVRRYAGTLDEITPGITETEAKIWTIACTDFNAFADRHAARPRAW